MTERGVALILVILITTFLSALALGMATIVSMSQLAEANYTGSVGMLYAADAGIALAAHDLAQTPDWDLVLSGAAPGAFVDGVPSGVRDIPAGGLVWLDRETNQLNCAKATACTTAQMNANTRERPWGANNARWRLLEFGPLSRVEALAGPVPWYLLVWVADDGRETDGNPMLDGSAADKRGRGILRVRAEVFGAKGARRAVEAELARLCAVEDGVETCQPGLRVQSWQEVRQLVP